MSPITMSTLWMYVVPPVISLLVLFILRRRSWFKSYPGFTILLFVEIFSTAVFLPFAFWLTKSTQQYSDKLHYYRLYFYAFWTFSAVESLIVFIILYRIFFATFSKYSSLRRWTFVLYMLALIVCLVLAIFVVPAAINARGVFSIVVPIWQASMLFRVGILVFLFLVLFGIGIPIRDYLFGIAAGLGVNAAIKLSTTVTLARWPYLWVFAYMDQLADLIANGIWFVYLFVPRKTSEFYGDLTGSTEVARWKDVLSGFLHK